MIYNPFKLLVTFPDGKEEVMREYKFGATDAVNNMAKAINYYTSKKIACTIRLSDHLNKMIVEEVLTFSSPSDGAQ